MATTLGIDIGTNSVGSAWVDPTQKLIVPAVSIFPAGVEDSDRERGAPKNQTRRQKRSQRRSIARRAKRKRLLREFLVNKGLLPAHGPVLEKALRSSPWSLRKEGLDRPLTPFEFGRVLLHLAQRRGSFGIEIGEDREETGKMKKALLRTEEERRRRKSRTFGEMMADLMADPNQGPAPKTVRNRGGSYEFQADRRQIMEEFHRLWEAQKSFKSELSPLLTDDLRLNLDDPAQDPTWIRGGLLFQQRRTYWSTSTIGRCELEPTDHKCPAGDMYAQEFLVLDAVNNVRLTEPGQVQRLLTKEEREEVLEALSRQKNAKAATIRKALGLARSPDALNVDADSDRKIPTNWFVREVIRGVFGEDQWNALSEATRCAVNRALLKNWGDAAKLREGAKEWWELTEDQAGKLVDAWEGRPSPNKRVNLSRRAIRNLLPYMRQGMNLMEARKSFAEDPASGATDRQRARYAPGAAPSTKAMRRFLAKHPRTLPPPPFLSNPVVRKAIHEVRRHVNEYLQRFGKPPDRVVVELAREAYQTAKRRNEELAANRDRERARADIVERFDLGQLDARARSAAAKRIELWDEDQRKICPYCGKAIALGNVVNKVEVEVEHIIPRSRGGNSTRDNLLLVHTPCNRNKLNLTTKEAFSPDQFDEMCRHVSHLKEVRPRKWQNLQREAPPIEEFAERQLRDTSYAARQVADYLRATLFNGDKTKVIVTKGNFTAALRHQWGLNETAMSEFGSPPPGAPEVRAARLEGKDRTDHRHHAVDAVVIALTDHRMVQSLALREKDIAEAREKGRRPSTTGIDPPAPWTSTAGFRADVVAAVRSLTVCHRPEKRRIVGALHKDTPYGHAAMDYSGLFVDRMSVRDLTSSNLRPPRKRIVDGRTIWHIEGKGQGVVVRDRGLRKAIVECLKKHGLDPDNFEKQDVRSLTDPADYRLRLPSGVPIRNVRVLRTITDPLPIPGKDGVMRHYRSGSNHHMEILEDERTGKWIGFCRSMFEVARRIRPPKGQPSLPPVLGRELDRLRKNNLLPPKVLEDYTGKRFVMSLSIGETIHARHKGPLPGQPGAAGYFVVEKMDDKKVYFSPHWDARRADQQDRWEASAAQLKNLGPEPGQPPYKVRVNPLGEIVPWPND